MKRGSGEAGHRRDDQEVRSGEGRIPCHASPGPDETNQAERAKSLLPPGQRRGARLISRQPCHGGCDSGATYRGWVLTKVEQGRIAQTVEHKTQDLDVAGSNPAPTLWWETTAGRRRTEVSGRLTVAERGSPHRRGSRQRTGGHAAYGYRFVGTTAADPDQTRFGGHGPGGKPPARATQDTLRPRLVIGNGSPSPEGGQPRNPRPGVTTIDETSNPNPDETKKEEVSWS